MIHKLIRYNKIYDYIDIKNIEVKMSLCTTLIIFIVMLWIKVHSNFDVFAEYICDGVLCIIGALIGILGILLAGVAFVASLFTPDYVDAVACGLKALHQKKKFLDFKNGEEVVEDILNSFIFLSLHIGLYIIYLIVIYFLINSTISIIPILQFYIVTIISIYMLVFTLFYTISLIYSCVDLNIIKTRFYKSYKVEKTFYEKANEIRIDMVIATLLSNYQGDKKAVILDSLNDIIEKSNYSECDKSDLMLYFKKVYDR